MWQLLLPLALGLGAMGLDRAELTAAQHRGLQVALEEFHNHPPVQWTFQVTSVDSAMDMVSTSPARGGWGQGSGDWNVPLPRRAGATMLGPLRAAQLSRERLPAQLPTPPAPGSAAARWGAGTGQTRNSPAGSAGPRAFLLSVCSSSQPGSL